MKMMGIDNDDGDDDGDWWAEKDEEELRKSLTLGCLRFAVITSLFSKQTWVTLDQHYNQDNDDDDVYGDGGDGGDDNDADADGDEEHLVDANDPSAWLDH